MLDWVQIINALQRSSQSTFSNYKPFQPLLRNIAGEVVQGNTFCKGSKTGSNRTVSHRPIKHLCRVTPIQLVSCKPFQRLFKVEQVQADLLVICFLLLSAPLVKYVRYKNKRKVAWTSSKNLSLFLPCLKNEALCIITSLWQMTGLLV